MADNGKGLRTEVLVALIGLAGVVAVALIENWDKIFARSSPAASQTSPSVIVSPGSTPSQSQQQTSPGRSPDAVNSPDPRSPVLDNRSVRFPGSGFPGFSEATDQSLNGCTITVERPLVRLMSEASHFSPSVLEVQPGSYPATVYRLVSTGGGAIKDGWFQTQVEGRTGWISSELIGAKTNGCP